MSIYDRATPEEIHLDCAWRMNRFDELSREQRDLYNEYTSNELTAAIAAMGQRTPVRRIRQYCEARRRALALSI